MESVHVDLSSLQEIRYDNDNDNAIMEINIKNDSTYQYFDVPRFDFDGVVSILLSQKGNTPPQTFTNYIGK